MATNTTKSSAYTPTPADITINNHKPTDPTSILFKNVQVLDSTGRTPYLGNVLIEKERITQVGDFTLPSLCSLKIIDGHGTKILMSGLADTHTHLSWNNAATVEELNSLPIEEHVLSTANSALTYLDCGYTMCFGAASARPRLDIAIKSAIKSGIIPGPRTLSNAQEISTTGGAIIPGISLFADGPDEMRKVVSECIALGADNIKLSMTGDDIVEGMGSEETYFSLEETVAAVEEAHKSGKRVCAHARSAESVKICCLAGLDVIYHADFVDEEGMKMLEERKGQVWVAPAINLPLACVNGESAPFGLTAEMAVEKGIKSQVEAACKAMTELHKRGVKVLPGGDYGFAWTAHGTYARDLQHFVELFGFTPMEAIIAATAGGGDIMGHPEELGKVLPGYYADVILVDGNPLEDITILQNVERLHAIVINGHIHKPKVDA